MESAFKLARKPPGFFGHFTVATMQINRQANNKRFRLPLSNYFFYAQPVWFLLNRVKGDQWRGAGGDGLSGGDANAAFAVIEADDGLNGHQSGVPRVVAEQGQVNAH